MKKIMLKIALFVFFVVAMIAGGIGSNKESSIIARHNKVPQGDELVPLNIKGGNYYVTENDAYIYNASVVFFAFGIFSSIALILLIKRGKEK